MTLKNKLTLIVLSLFFSTANAQLTERTLTMEEVVQLALENHTQLQLSKDNIQIARQQTRIAELQKLPSINATANAFYLG